MIHMAAHGDLCYCGATFTGKRYKQGHPHGQALAPKLRIESVSGCCQLGSLRTHSDASHCSCCSSGNGSPKHAQTNCCARLSSGFEVACNFGFSGLSEDSQEGLRFY